MVELASVEAEPKVDGRNMVMVLAPLRGSRARVVPQFGARAEQDGAVEDMVDGGPDDVVEENVEEQVEEQVEA